ncbi:tripartite motif-containing protein 2 [Aphelenchoides avenae]|nr:tripartite motif-containing protein 2 [Aphelenchus avenae]
MDLKANLECPICLEPFREPKILGCGHCVCKNCLTKLVTGSPLSATCPECREVSLVPRTGFPTNYRLTDIISKMAAVGVSEDASRTAPCTGCWRNVPEADLFLCISCDEALGMSVVICGVCGMRAHREHQTIAYCMASPQDVQKVRAQVTVAQEAAKNTVRSVTETLFEAIDAAERAAEALESKAAYFGELLDELQPASAQWTKKDLHEMIGRCEKANLEMSNIYVELTELAVNYRHTLDACVERIQGAACKPTPSAPPHSRPSSSGHDAGITATALVDYERVDDTWLRFKKDDVITDIVKVGKRWWRDTCHGRRGIFPVDSVRLH